MTDRHAAALDWARQGFPVFPIYPVDANGDCTCTPPGEACRGGSPGKHPMPGAPQGFKNATLDLVAVETWYQTVPGDDDPTPNIGLATGGPFWVLDIDPKSGGLASLSELEKEHGALPTTHRIRTGSGGWHYYFANGERPAPCRTNVRPGIDTRGEGGYVVTAPSNHASGGTYEVESPAAFFSEMLPEAPEWLVELVLAPKARLGDPGAFSSPTDEVVEAKVLADLQAALPFIDAEDRDRWLRVGMALKRGGEEHGAPQTFFAVWNSWASASEKFDPRDARRVWDSIDPCEDGVTLRAVFGMAMQAGWANGSREVAVAVASDELEILPPLDGPEFPEHLLETDGLLDELRQWIDAASPSPLPVASLGASLVSLGTLMGRRYRSETNLRTNLYVIVTAYSGAGKNGARSALQLLFQSVGAMRHLGGSWKSGPAILADLKEQPSRLYLADEFGDTLGAMTSPRAPAHLARALPLLKDLATAAHLDYLPESAASKELRDEAQPIIEPNLSIYGTTTPAPFFDAISRRQLEDGFGPRFIVFPIPDHDPLDNPQPALAPPTRLVERVRDLIAAGKPSPAKLGNLAAAGAEIGLGPAAKASPAKVVPAEGAGRAYLDAFRARLRKSDQNLRDILGHGSVVSLWRRAYERSVQVAMIRAVARDPREPRISETDARWAVELVSWSIRSFEAGIEYRLHDTRGESQRQRVLRLVVQAGQRGVGRSALMRESKLSKRELDAALDDLIESRRVGLKEGDNTHGPRAKIYFARVGEPE